MSGVKVSGLSSVDMKTTFVTKAGATSNSRARIVVTTAAGIDASTIPACRAAPDRPSIEVRPIATKGAATSESATAAITTEGRSAAVARSSCIPEIETCEKAGKDTFRFCFQEKSAGPISIIRIN